jgi:CheY-like chemotaxis protein
MATTDAGNPNRRRSDGFAAKERDPRACVKSGARSAAAEGGQPSGKFWRPPDPQLDDLLGMLAHELRAPLDAILGWAELLRSEPPSKEDLQAGLEVICRKTRLQASLISDLLRIWELRSGRLSLDRRPVHLNDLVRQAVAAARTPGQPEITFDVEPADHAFSILGDREYIEQAFAKVLGVATAVAPADGVLSVLIQEMPGAVRIEFCGRHPSDALSESRGRYGLAARINGIPLLLVRQIVEHHGGALEIEYLGGRPGILITLPALSKTAEAVDAPAESHTATPAPPPSLEGLRVLVVDDDLDARDLCMTSLTRYGAAVTTAGSTHDALAILNTRDVDVLITDIMMPGEDGYELLRRLRAFPSASRAGMPAVALTACSRSEDRSRTAHAGFQLHLTKPIDPVSLAEAVGGLWSARQAG